MAETEGLGLREPCAAVERRAPHRLDGDRGIKAAMATFFSDYFGVSPDVLEGHGAFNISTINDLPLFIDPFLLFNSDKDAYQQLHAEMIRYLVFLGEGSVRPSE